MMMLKWVYISSRKLFQAQEYRELIFTVPFIAVTQSLVRCLSVWCVCFFILNSTDIAAIAMHFCLMHSTYV